MDIFNRKVLLFYYRFHFHRVLSRCVLSSENINFILFFDYRFRDTFFSSGRTIILSFFEATNMGPSNGVWPNDLTVLRDPFLFFFFVSEISFVVIPVPLSGTIFDGLNYIHYFSIILMVVESFLNLFQCPKV